MSLNHLGAVCGFVVVVAVHNMSDHVKSKLHSIFQWKMWKLDRQTDRQIDELLLKKISCAILDDPELCILNETVLNQP